MSPTSAERLKGLIELSLPTQSLVVDSHEIRFSPKEFIIAEALFVAMVRGDRPVHRDHLINALYLLAADEPISAVDGLRIYICKMRQKLYDTSAEIRTFRRVGYSLLYIRKDMRVL